MSRLGCRLANAAAWITARALFRIDAQDVDKIPMKGPYILISNHVSALELPPLRMLMNPRFVRTLAKIETWDKKLLGWVLDQWEAIPIKRGESDMAALRASLQVLKDGGILILVAECRDGVGEEAFVKLLSASPDPSEALKEIGRGYKLGFHKAAKIAEIAEWAQMWAVSDLDPDVLGSVFIRPFPTLQGALDEALEVKGKDASILFLMAASMTVPRVV